MKTIYLETNYLTLSKLNEFNNILNTNLYEEKICIDLNGIGFCDPQTILCLAVMLRDFDMKRGQLYTDISIRPNNNVIGYLAHIGFFDFIGANFGNKIGEVSVGESYIPIRAINKTELLRESYETGKSLQDLVQEEASYLARVLVGSNWNEQIYLTIAYSVREAIRNALEHSEEDICFVCGQRWTNNRAQIAVIDEGIGIYQSLVNAEINVSDENFLQVALQAGLSRTLNIEESLNIHGNSGFGLYVLYHLAKNYGRMTISSSGKTLIAKRAKNGIEERDSSFIGTCISIEFSMYPNDVADVISMIADSGEEEAKEAGRQVKASSRSRSVKI
ncbi:ATP-binding protein [Acinetobacter sp. WCHA55]|uniref:ATP-binding protein n=1 Tax=Acinetobacter sp. WCHA55 TaxID=2004646 RepID=UPI000B3CA78E|nr:ATP-binding protein [Acinetobacter sp. WCHA55]AYA69929.1 ATP-binding protein [Acinetobacter sp. WCHA55]